MRALTIAVVALLGAAPGATAAPAVTPPQRPLDLPAPGMRSAEAENWIVGAAPGGALLTAIARLHCARDLGVAGAYALPVGRARAFAASLRRAGLLRYAEPDRRQRPLAAAISPAEARRTAWRTASVADGLRPPPVTRSSPLLALVDSAADRTHPEWRRSGSLAVLRGADVTDVHGTATASVAGAPANGFGVVGLWPGMRLLNVPAATPRGVSCAAAVRGIATALRSGARAINLSFGAPFPCYAQYEAVSLAVARGVLVVAAAGNRRTARPRPVLFPAAFPHVLSVAAYGPSGPGGRYATTGGAVDVAAPGERIAAAVPPALDREQAADGVALVDGTSFSAPIVAAAGAWLLQARPRLRADQVAAALRASARDLGPPGFDAASGHGALDLAAALRAPAPARDAQEVDDDVEWVTGRRHTRPAPVLFAGAGPAAVTASVDARKDPADVYRVRIPAGRSISVTLRPTGAADPGLALYAGSARSVFARRGRIATGRRGPGRTRTLTARPRGDGRAYVVVYGPARRSRDPRAPYRLGVG